MHKYIALSQSSLQHAFFVGLLPGFIGGAGASVMTYPIDVIKSRIQNDTSRHHLSMRNVASKLTFRGMYQGASLTIWGLAGARAVKFFVYEGITHRIQNTALSPYPTASAFIGGGIAGMAQGVILTPIELLKIRLQLRQEKTGPYHMFKEVFRAGGFSGLSKGLGPVVVLKGLWNGVYFPTVLVTQNQFKAHGYNPKDSTISFISGLLGGGLASVSNVPFDVVRTRVQGRPEPITSFEAAKDIFINEGMKGFYKGTGAKVAYYGLAGGLTYLFVQKLADRFN